MKVIQDLAALYSALLLLTGESGQVRDSILHVSGSKDVETVESKITVTKSHSQREA